MKEQNNELRQIHEQPTVRHLFTREYTLNGGTYEDAITVKGKFVFSRMQRIVYRAVCAGCTQARIIQLHLRKKGFSFTLKQISATLQRLQKKEFVKYEKCLWEVKP